MDFDCTFTCFALRFITSIFGLLAFGWASGMVVHYVRQAKHPTGPHSRVAVLAAWVNFNLAATAGITTLARSGVITELPFTWVDFTAPFLMASILGCVWAVAGGETEWLPDRRDE